jgi:dATP pyrophosphohydrolase
MARAPFQVLVYPYRKHNEGEFEYALLRRSDGGWWQAVAGGGEENETPIDAARRESQEEAGIPPESHFLPLDTIESVRVTEFEDRKLWGESVYVIPQYFFGVLVQSDRIILLKEHTEYRWLTYDDAMDLLRYDGDKTALWELNRRLQENRPERG